MWTTAQSEAVQTQEKIRLLAWLIGGTGPQHLVEEDNQLRKLGVEVQLLGMLLLVLDLGQRGRDQGKYNTIEHTAASVP
jgi:hypothetical protein